MEPAAVVLYYSFLAVVCNSVSAAAISEKLLGRGHTSTGSCGSKREAMDHLSLHRW